jgi:amino acid permease
MLVLVGWGMGYILLIVSAFASVWSNLILASLAEKLRIPNYDGIVLKAGGPCL